MFRDFSYNIDYYQKQKDDDNLEDKSKNSYNK